MERANREQSATSQLSADEREGGDVDAAVDNCAGALGRIVTAMCHAWSAGGGSLPAEASRVFTRSLDALVVRGGLPLRDDLGEGPPVAAALADAVALAAAPADVVAHVAQRHNAIMSAWAASLLADAGTSNPSVAAELAAMQSLYASASALAAQNNTPWVLESDIAPRAARLRIERAMRLKSVVARGVASMGAAAATAAASSLDEASRMAVQSACA